eukprot:TRINITY_DN2835_c0_g1_i1.p1 TRINITY_DN2835_c0_g1~~TRINITY_DN2835_c0_g1_i1.p1  ORF type:complete len:1000 (+),score=216.38 TRINITY_DN2835_c0_g1_i1:372-3002(+)
MSQPSVIRLKPYTFIHVLDNNSGVTLLKKGPQTFTRQDHEKVLGGPFEMIAIPPRHYCRILNPVLRDSSKKVEEEEDENLGEVPPVFDAHGNVRLRHGDQEIRFEQEPFPLYPGEELRGSVTPLTIVSPDSALRLSCIRDFTDVNGTKRQAGDEWLFRGPGTYYPRVEVEVVETRTSSVILPNQALRLRAGKAFTDPSGTKRKAGEEWLIRTPGSYMAGVDEDIVDTLSAFVLTDSRALHVRATRTYVDTAGHERKAGEEWLVPSADFEAYIPDVYESIIGDIPLTTLTNRQYSVINDPVSPTTGKPQFGQSELRVGEASFFLQPGESLENGIQEVYVLGEQEGLLLKAKEEFEEILPARLCTDYDDDTVALVEGDDKMRRVVHRPGDRWMIRGPTDYVPPVQVEVVEARVAIALDENEGIYVRDIKSGQVRLVCGESYSLKPNEEKWEKDLPAAVEELLQGPRGQARDKTLAVTYRVSHNAALQVYDYKKKQSRVVFGPELVMLAPDEHFTVISLSGGKPKRPHQIKALGLLLGPDFMTDVITVETSDHARLQLKLSYNWHFDVNAKTEEAERVKIFAVPDFVGDCCKYVASRVRGAVAAASFDAFHKTSARIIRVALFGVDAADHVNPSYFFGANRLVITNCDIQSVEPVDARTRDALQKSVQLAIEITTNSQEATARHKAQQVEQEARGALERQKITDESGAETARRELLKLQAQSAAVESTGQAAAEAKARAEALTIEGEAAVQQARFKAEANRVENDALLETQMAKQEAEISHMKAMDQLGLEKSAALSQVEAEKFKKIVDAIGRDTLAAMARAGPEMQARLLKGLGLKSFMITDGNTPINLFQTANGLVGAGGAAAIASASTGGGVVGGV